MYIYKTNSNINNNNKIYEYRCLHINEIIYLKEIEMKKLVTLKGHYIEEKYHS